MIGTKVRIFLIRARKKFLSGHLIGNATDFEAICLDILELVCIFAGENKQKTMATTTLLPSQQAQMIVTLEDKAMAAEIKRVLRMIRGVASVRMARVNDDNQITPALHARIKKAREESARGETIVCNTPDEMQKYFDSL